MAEQKHHVTVEDCPTTEASKQYQRSAVESNQPQMGGMPQQNSDWEQVDALEEQARDEKLHDGGLAKKNATKTAKIVEEEISK